MPDGIQATCVACLSCELVSERHGVVCSVPHPGGRLPEGHSGCIQQARVGGTQRMPPHAGTVEVPHRVYECLACSTVVTSDGEIHVGKDCPCAVAKRYDPKPCPSLRGIRAAVSMGRTPDSEEMAVYIDWLNRDDLPPTEARQQDELGDAAPHARHTLDDVLDVLEREGVLTGFRSRYPRAAQGER